MTSLIMQKTIEKFISIVIESIKLFLERSLLDSVSERREKGDGETLVLFVLLANSHALGETGDFVVFSEFSHGI